MSHPVVHGLTVAVDESADRRRSITVSYESSQITLDNLLIEPVAEYGVRIQRSRDVCIQKNLFRNTTHADTNDLIGVSITPVETAEEQH
ncbi:MAG: hypothetical protein ABW092_11385, partial [Candidatus Thiodiazotropha sp.]